MNEREGQMDPIDTFSKMGRTFQEKVVQSLLQDSMFAEQMCDVLDPRFFELRYLQEIVRKFYDHKIKFKTYPSPELVEIMVSQDENLEDREVLVTQVRDYLTRAKDHPLNGDSGFIQHSSLDFCKRQTLKEAMVKAIGCMEESDYDSIQTVIKDALNKGASRDLGHEYMESFASRTERTHKKHISTGWPVLDNELNGGWERAILATFIAPTGAGKSMFLVNIGAAGIAQGLNVLYITCEMADYKIGLRFDSYFSGVEINNVPSQKERVETVVRENVKGRLFIKEFATKTASVQTIRSYIQRLTATKNFIPDIVIVDYADLLRSTRGFGEKRHELEAVYEELRALAQELNVVVVTADQTNRSGLNEDIVTLSAIAEAYAKATVCDAIFTISRKMEDRQANTGRLFVAKSRLGRDGDVFPFTLNSATVKVTLLNKGTDPLAMLLDNRENMQQTLSDRFKKLIGNGGTGTGGGSSPPSAAN
jgi:archaellum biogenesis ATPase FlaH